MNSQDSPERVLRLDVIDEETPQGTHRYAATERRILRWLVRNQGRWVTRETLITAGWGRWYAVGDQDGYNALRTVLSRVRPRLREDGYLVEASGTGMNGGRYRLLRAAQARHGTEAA